MNINNQKICFYGGGNMAFGIIAGLINAKFNPDNIYVIDRNQSKCDNLIDKFKINARTNPNDYLVDADIIILSVKPKDINNNLNLNKIKLKSNCFIISLAAGINLKKLANLFTKPIVRAMPNMAAIYNESATSLITNVDNKTIAKLTTELFNLIGKTFWLDTEEQIHIATAIAGSGPGFLVKIMQGFYDSGINNKLSKNTSLELIQQTLISSAHILSQDLPFYTIISNIASKGGTTEAGLQILEKSDINNIIEAAITAAVNKSSNWN